jgi:hypothetical protein
VLYLKTTIFDTTNVKCYLLCPVKLLRFFYILRDVISSFPKMKSINIFLFLQFNNSYYFIRLCARMAERILSPGAARRDPLRRGLSTRGSRTPWVSAGNWFDKVLRTSWLMSLSSIRFDKGVENAMAHESQRVIDSTRGSRTPWVSAGNWQRIWDHHDSWVSAGIWSNKGVENTMTRESQHVFDKGVQNAMTLESQQVFDKGIKNAMTHKSKQVSDSTRVLITPWLMNFCSYLISTRVSWTQWCWQRHESLVVCHWIKASKRRLPPKVDIWEC